MSVEALETDRRYTPERVLEVVREFAPIGLDPCTEQDNPTRAAFAFSPPQDGLTETWGGYGLVFVNCPYSRGQLMRWMAKCAVEYHQHGTEIIALIPSDLGSLAGQHTAVTCDALCFVRGRLAFGNPAGQLPQGAKQPSVMPYWGERAGRFKRIFSQLGTVWVR